MPHVLDHVHTYVRWQKKFGEIQYKCADPDCNHFAPRSFIIGKRTLCSVCHKNTFILTYKDLRLANPRCEECSNSTDAQIHRKFKNLVNQVLGPEEDRPKFDFPFDNENKGEKE